MNPSTYRAQINKAIRHLGVKIVAASAGGRSLGYSYFKSLKTDDQIGGSVMVYRQTDMTLDRWVDSAEYACAEHRKDGYNLDALPAVS